MLFTRDRNFYRTLFHLMIIVVFQNIIAYSINMADNLMLGMYSQSSLSGAATVNQIQFLLQQMTLAIGDTLVITYRDCVGNRINPWTDCIYTDHIVSKRNFNAIYKKGKLHYTRNGLPFTDPFYLSFICAVYDLNGGTSKR